MNFFKLIFTTSILLSTYLFSSPLIIGISGASGSGKTTLARQLNEKLGDKVTVITQDNYYHDVSDLTFEEKKLANFDCPSSIDFTLLTEHLIDLKNNQIIHQPNYDFRTHSRTNLMNVIKPTDIIVVEGALLFTIPEIRKLCDIKLYIDVDMDICLCRRIERDQKERGRSFEDIKRQYFSTVRPMFLQHVEPSKVYADLIIPNENENHIALNFLIHRLIIAEENYQNE